MTILMFEVQHIHAATFIQIPLKLFEQLVQLIVACSVAVLAMLQTEAGLLFLV